MKQPVESDFTVTKSGGGISVTFKPSDSHSSFNLLADAADIARHGPLSSDVRVRHGATGDTGDYPSDSVLAMARKLAESAAP
jgi:hypothetical protein